jgi:hypothetical protein
MTEGRKVVIAEIHPDDSYYHLREKWVGVEGVFTSEGASTAPGFQYGIFAGPGGHAATFYAVRVEDPAKAAEREELIQQIYRDHPGCSACFVPGVRALKCRLSKDHDGPHKPDIGFRWEDGEERTAVAPVEISREAHAVLYHACKNQGDHIMYGQALEILERLGIASAADREHAKVWEDFAAEIQKCWIKKGAQEDDQA